MLKKFLVLILAVMMVTALFTGCKSEQKPAEKKIIKVSIGLNEQHPEYLALQEFKKEVEAKTNGRYEVQVYANAQLGDDVKATESVRMGTLEMTGPSSSPLSGISPELMVFDLPFLFPNTEIAYKVLDGPVGQRLLDSLSAKGLKGLAYYENGFRHVTNSVRAIKTPADTKGLKIRTMENPIHLATWKALGASPTPMPFSEVFTAMQQHTIDGQENPVPTNYLQKFHEVQKHMTLSGHVYTPHLILMSQKIWDTMSKEDQKIFQDAANKGKEHVRKISKELNESLTKKLEEEGMTVTKLTPEQLKAFQDAVKPVYDEFDDKIGVNLVKEILAEVEKYSK
jgi:TRAP-type transport system periplasmic protein